jgi:hypothetical protein
MRKLWWLDALLLLYDVDWSPAEQRALMAIYGIAVLVLAPIAFLVLGFGGGLAAMLVTMALGAPTSVMFGYVAATTLFPKTLKAADEAAAARLAKSGK